MRDEITYFVQNAFLKPRLYDLDSPERVGCVYRVPSDMCVTDRLMIYALVRGLKPKRAIEIGVRWGNSARIITNAMEENGIGKLVGIDPSPESFRVSERELHGRYTLIRGYSPAAIAEAVEKLGGEVDFAFVDGMHIYDAVKSDLNGLLPFLDEGAYVLLHDTYHQGIDQAIQQVCAQNSGLFDCGFLTRTATVGLPVSYQGLRLLRAGGVNSEKLITAAYIDAKQIAPPFSKNFWNRDVYYDYLKGGFTRWRFSAHCFHGAGQYDVTFQNEAGDESLYSVTVDDKGEFETPAKLPSGVRAALELMASQVDR